MAFLKYKVFCDLSILLLLSQILLIEVTCDNSLKVQFATNRAFHLGEGPFWDDYTKSLFFIDTFKGDVCQLNVNTTVSDCYNLKDYISIVIPVDKYLNRLIVSKRNILIKFDWTTKTYQPIADVGREKFNDGKVDALGRLWIGTLKNNIYDTNEGAIRFGGALYRLDGHELTRMDTMSLPNGMAWNSDNTKYYLADTVERVIYVYDFDLKTGTILNKKILLDMNNNPDFRVDELPDGMAIDKYDNLWIAIIFGGRVIQINTKTGKIQYSIPLPSNQTTSIAFGGPDYRDMYVTTGNRDLTDAEKPLNPNVGKLLRLTANYIKGPGPAFRVKLHSN